jgi:hypothetical protein
MIKPETPLPRVPLNIKFIKKVGEATKISNFEEKVIPMK